MNIPPICEVRGMEKFSDKKTFSSAGCQEVLEAVKDKKYVIICGIEAHVCVLQTVIDLKRNGISAGTGRGLHFFEKPA